MIEEKYGDELDIEQVNAIMDSADADGDGTLDITEFIGSMEDYETMEELVEEKVFPSTWQKRMMSKSWNDTVWPILHVGFGLLIAIFIANGMFGFVDGSGGNIAYEPNDSGLIPSGNIVEGDIYPCDEKFQKDGCRNSLTPLAGENGSLVNADQLLLGRHPLHYPVSDWNGSDTVLAPGQSTGMARTCESHARV